MRRGLPIIAVLLVVMLLVTAGSVFAAKEKAKAPEPAAPAPSITVFDQNTEVFYEVRYEWFNTKNLLTDSFARLQKVEVLEPVFKMINDQLGISLENDVFSWIGNTASAGIVGEDNSSVLHDGMEYMFGTAKAKGELTATVSNMKNIGTALEMYSTDYNGKYPEKLAKLAPNYLKTIPKPARGGEFRYWVNKKKTAFIVKAPADMFKDLGITGDKLQFSSKDGISGNIPSAPEKTFKFHNYMFAFEVRDMEKAVPALARIEKVINSKIAGKDEAFATEAQGKYVFHNGPFCYTFAANQLVIADSVSMLKKAVATAENQEKSIYNGKVYKNFMKACPQAAKHNEIYFINLEKINIETKYFHDATKKLGMHYHGDGLCSCEEGSKDNTDYTALDQTIKGLSYLAGYTNWGDNELSGEFQLHFKADANIGIMKKYFATKPYENNMMETLPSGLPLVAVYNAGELVNFLNAVSQEIPAFGSSFDKFKQEAAQAIGMDPEKDLLASTTGEIGITYLLRDVFIGTIISTLQEVQAMKSPVGNPGNEMPTPAGKFMKGFNRFPITFFVTVKDQPKIGKLLDLLKTKMTFSEEKYKDVTIYKSKELVYCIVGDKLILHTYPSTVKVKEFIDGLKSGSPLFGETSKFRDFKKNITGRPVLIMMQDAEWAVTLAKGFYLLFLPEFADYATYLQNYRESWTALSVTPDGFHYTYRLFKK
ncbi:MAG: hypothetical protein LWY06_01860 [Firmicutes bacterium]|nr:hypothetical protein [Bacillota bacterium]